MNPRVGWSVIGILAVVIVVLTVMLFAGPAPSTDGKRPSPTPAPTPFTSANVRVSAPLPGTVLGKTFRVAGEARGSWYFEANLPLLVKDMNGNTVGNGFAMAQGEWMTTDFVPFEGKVEVDAAFSGPATLVVMKDNPSGLPENDDSIDFSIVIQ
jgi:hypothetical protein